jgi:hypothetical protein
MIQFDLVLYDIEEGSQLARYDLRNKPLIGTNEISSENHTSNQGMETTMIKSEEKSRVYVV